MKCFSKFGLAIFYSKSHLPKHLVKTSQLSLTKKKKSQLSITIYKENMGFLAELFIIQVILLNKFAYKNGISHILYNLKITISIPIILIKVNIS